MQIAHEFIRLPFSFDAELLKAEILAFDETQWCPHPDGFEGNNSLPLVTVDGKINNAFIGEMKVTDALNSAPYLQQVLASFGQVIGRSRLMRLAPGTEVPPHTDTNFHWFKRVRIHIPIITDNKVIFQCGDKSLNMRPGEAWIFDSWKYHEVHNNGNTLRVHLVIDTCGDADFWEMVAERGVPFDQYSASENTTEFVPYVKEKTATILTESTNGSLILNPGELDNISQHLLDTIRAIHSNDRNEISKIEKIVRRLCQDWRSSWYLHGQSAAGLKTFEAHRAQAYSALNAIDPDVEIDNGTSAKMALIYCLILPLINADFATVEAKTSRSESSPTANSSVQASAQSDTSPNDRELDASSQSRNSHCSCGSGKKFKHCHGQLS